MIDIPESIFDIEEFIDSRYTTYNFHRWRDRTMGVGTFVSLCERRAEGKWDEIRNPHDFVFESGKSEYVKLKDGTRLTDRAICQIAALTGVRPRSLLADHRAVPGLQDRILTELCAGLPKGQKAFCRFRSKHGPVLRAVLSTKYQRFDQPEVARLVGEVLPKGTTILSVEDDGDSLCFRALLPVGATGSDGSIWQAGIAVTNFENGGGAFTASQYILIGSAKHPQGQGRVPIGVVFGAYDYLGDSMKRRSYGNFDRQAAQAQISKVATGARLNAHRFSQAAAVAQGIAVPDAAAVIEHICREEHYRYRLGKGFARLWYDVWREQREGNVWGIVTAMARATNSLSGPERLNAETVCGRILMPRNRFYEKDILDRCRKLIEYAKITKSARSPNQQFLTEKEA